MKAIFVFAILLLVKNCYMHFRERSFNFKPRKPLKEAGYYLRDEACLDDPDYADGCPEQAAIPNYCKDQERFMRKHCPRSCGFCFEGPTAPPLASIVETECKDDPSVDCKDIAQTEGLCKEQEEFTRQSCAMSCNWCEPREHNAPAPEICEQDLPKWAKDCPEWAEAGDCEDPKKQIFMEHYCRKSCKLPCKTEPLLQSPTEKPPAPPAFCRDRDVNCARWKSLGACESNDANVKSQMAVYCGITCDICKAPNPDECYDMPGVNCEELKKEGECRSTIPIMEYNVKTNCLVTCGFCVPMIP